MKRSEMVLRIATMSVLSKIKLKDEKPEDERVTASAILDLVEKRGMKPPQRNADLESSNGYAQLWEWNKE